jgi:hypothetical protein
MCAHPGYILLCPTVSSAIPEQHHSRIHSNQFCCQDHLQVSMTMALGSIEKDVEVVNQLENVNQIMEIGDFRVVGLDHEDAEFFKEFPEERRKRIYRKVRGL